MKPAVIYHQVKPGIDCADGIAAAWVAKRKYPDAVLIGASYGGEVPDISQYDRVLVVDFSFPLNILEEWDEQTELTVIDHHKTAMNDLSGFANAYFDMAESGATLTWKILFPDEPVPAFLEYVKDRDLWNFALPLSEEIHEAMAFTGRKFYQLDQLAKFTAEDLQAALGPLGAKLLEPKRERIADIAMFARYESVLGHKVMAVEIAETETRLTSDICSYIYKRFPEASFVVAYSYKSKENEWSLSFRSDKAGNDFDVSVISKQFSGGGHKNAAGGMVKDIKELFS